MDIKSLTLCAVRDKIASGEISARSVVECSLKEIERDKRLNAVISVNHDALALADEVDRKIAKGESVGVLAGVPIAVKDNISTAGLLTTCGSRMLESYIPPFDATVVERLKSAGAIIVAKANMDEFGMGSLGENSAFGATHNPADEARAAGGSSSGSAAMVAGLQCYGALGSDTGGSVRIPAAYCGAVGMKPTRSVVSRYGLIAYASSLDTVGTITRTVEDNALLLSVIAGVDYRDGTLVSVDTNYACFESQVKGKRIGIIKGFQHKKVQDEIARALNLAVQKLKDLGAEIVEVDIPSLFSATAAYYTIACAEAASNLARYDGVRYGKNAVGESFERSCILSRTEGFNDEVKRRIMAGNFVLSSGYYDKYYLKASKIRALLTRETEEAFKSCDIMLAPVSETTAPILGLNQRPTRIYEGDCFTVLASLTGKPALSLPFGKDTEGLPIGIQLIGKSYRERELYGVAKALEER